MIIELGKLLNEVQTKNVTTEKGEKTVLNNRIAIYQGKNKTTFIDITAWGFTAEFIGKHFNKGDEIYVEGELKNKSITIEDKTFQSSFILVNNVRCIYGKNAQAVEQEV